MDIIVGGAFQGKLNYALNKYGVNECDVQEVKSDKLDFTKKIYHNCHELVFKLAEQDEDVLGYFRENLCNLQDKVLIFDEISSGVVPVEPAVRRGREENSRALVYLCENADTVIRIFCGLPAVIKP